MDDGTPEPVIAPKVDSVPIRVHRFESNVGIAAASRQGLEIAGGSYIAFLDHDDVLAPEALGWIAQALHRHPQAGLIYTDEDKLGVNGRHDPHFKPEFNYDLLLAQNYVGHLLVVRRDLALATGAMGKGFDGSQDHDLVLRCIERLGPTKSCISRAYAIIGECFRIDGL